MTRKEYEFCEGLKWIDITEPGQADMDEINQEYGFHPHLIRDSMDPDHLPKYDEADDVRFLIIRIYVPSTDKRTAAIRDLSSKVAIFYTDQYLLTIHRLPLHFIDLIRTKYVATNRLSNIQEAVIRVIWYALETFNDPALRLSEKIDFMENQIFLKGINKEQIETLYYIKRQAATCQKILTLTTEPINHIRTPGADDMSLQDLKEQHFKMLTLYTQILDEVNNLTNLYVSFAAQRTNDVMKILTIFSVFFMPLTFVAGIYGMNFEHMPELKWQGSYPLVLLLMLVITAVIYFWFKRKKWL